MMTAQEAKKATEKAEELRRQKQEEAHARWQAESDRQREVFRCSVLPELLVDIERQIRAAISKCHGYVYVTIGPCQGADLQEMLVREALTDQGYNAVRPASLDDDPPTGHCESDAARRIRIEWK